MTIKRELEYGLELYCPRTVDGHYDIFLAQRGFGREDIGGFLYEGLTKRELRILLTPNSLSRTRDQAQLFLEDCEFFSLSNACCDDFDLDTCPIND